MKRAVTLILLFTLTARAMCQSAVQTNTAYQHTTAKTVALAFPGATTTHNLIVVHLDWDNQGADVSSLTDNVGNTYKKINGKTNWNGANYAADLWYAYNIAGGATTITATLSTNPTSFFQIYITEFSGIASSIDPLDQNSVATGNAAAINSGAKTTVYNNEMVYGAAIGATASISATGSFTLVSNANSNIIEYRKVSSPGSNAAAFTGAGAGNWVGQMATFISTISILPVSFTSFKGQCGDDGHVRLDWTTAEETNNNFFTVQQSVDGDSWFNIGTVKAAGNSASPESYTYSTNSEAGPVTWFRLQQTDVDGRFTYSNVITVNSCTLAVSALSIYPNPVNGSALTGRIDMGPGEMFTIEVVNSTGRIISRGTIRQPVFRVELPGSLAAGLYYARIASAMTTTVTPFLVK